MSRIGKKIISLPANVTASVSGASVKIKGPKGELGLDVIDGITAHLEGNTLSFTRVDDLTATRANHGLVRALVNNMVVGVTTGFARKLEIQGIGYKAEVKGKTLVMNLGYSHPIEFPIPGDVSIAVDKDGKLLLAGIDRARVGQVAANLRAYRPPDRYKGKGIRFEGEYVSLKAGKSA